VDEDKGKSDSNQIGKVEDNLEKENSSQSKQHDKLKDRKEQETNFITMRTTKLRTIISKMRLLTPYGHCITLKNGEELDIGAKLREKYGWFKRHSNPYKTLGIINKNLEVDGDRLLQLHIKKRCQ